MEKYTKSKEFEVFIPLITRWFGSSRSNIVNTIQKIANFFSKSFYIAIVQLIGIKIDFKNIISNSFLNKYGVKSTDISYWNDILSQKSTVEIKDLLKIIPELLHHSIDNRQKQALFCDIINYLFSKFCNDCNIKLNSDLRKPLNLTFSKYYEIIMFFDFLLEQMPKDLNSISNQNRFLRYGGHPGRFFDFLQQNQQKIINKTKKIKRSILPKNRMGSFYTPEWITDYINTIVFRYWVLLQKEVDKKIHQKLPIIADISAGMGFFTEKFVEPGFTRKLSQSKIFDNKLKDFETIGNNIYGYDSNKYFIDILRLNNGILRFMGCSAINISNYVSKNTLLEGVNRNFDILVGNPPWGSYINKKKITKISMFKKFTNKQFDSYSLFTIRNILSLRKNGLLFLVLPETILLNPNYFSIRDFILKNTTIIEIIHLGEDVFFGVNMPSIIIGLQNTPPHETHKIKAITNISEKLKKLLSNGEKNFSDLINDHTFHGKSELIITERLQSSFLKNNGLCLDIFTNQKDRKLIDLIEKGDNYLLKELVDNSRGVEIGKKGKLIQCPICSVWLSPPQWNIEPKTGNKYSKCRICKNKIYLKMIKKRDNIIIPVILDDKIERETILLGENVNKYYTKGEKLIKIGYRGIKYKPKKQYKKKKIVLRKTSKEIVATIDYQNRYTIQVVYQFSLKELFMQHKFLLEYILGVITSKIMQYYYSKKYQYQNRKNFPHHIQSNLLKLPIPTVPFNQKSSDQYESYIKIVFYSMLLMFLYQIVETGHFDMLAIKEFQDFIQINKLTLESEHITTQIFEQFDCKVEDLLKNPQKISDNNINTEFFENKLNDCVKMMFSIPIDD